MIEGEIKFATVLYDYERTEELEKATEIIKQLGNIGIHCHASDLENNGFAPSTPWLECEDGAIYYSHEIDNAIEQLKLERSAYTPRTTDE